MKHLLLSAFLILNSVLLFSQNTGIGTTTPEVSSILEMKSTTKGMLVPRMTQSERIDIISPAQGLLVYQTNLDTGFYFFKGDRWVSLHTESFGSQPVKQLTKILFFKQYDVPGGVANEYWIVKIDGSVPEKVPINLPPGMRIGQNNARLSPNGERLIFMMYDSTNKHFFYSVALDGSDMTKLYEGSSGEFLHIEDVF